MENKQTIIKKPLFISNYFLGNNSTYWDWYLWSYWGAGFFYECEKHSILGSLFFFLVNDYKDWIRYLTRIAVRLKSIDDIKELNDFITLANQRYFFEMKNNPNGLHSSILLNWFTMPVLNVQDVEELKSIGKYEIFQTNLNLFMGFYSEPMKHLSLDLPQLIFLNEIISNHQYFETVKKIFKGKEFKPTTAIAKNLNRLVELELLINESFEYLIESKKETTIMYSNYYTLDVEEFSKELSFSYFQKLSSYFKYLNDFTSLITEKQQQDIYNTLYPLSDKWNKQIASGKFSMVIDYVNEHKLNGLQKNFAILVEKLKNDWVTEKTLKDFFELKENEKGEIEKLHYPHNLFKPNYWYNGLPDFLFKKNNDNAYRWENEKETRIKPLFEKASFFKDWNEDDVILRYITYRGLLERILSVNKKFEFVHQTSENWLQEATKFMDIWSKIPKKYWALLETSKEQINNHSLDLNVFKEHLLEYLDDDQKQFLDTYWNIVLKYKSSMPRKDKQNIFSNNSVENDSRLEEYAITFKDYILQIEYEFFTIAYLNFSWYFNITFDYILFAKLHNIAVWPWRWSAAGSIISYLTYITDIDSIEYELLFERMLHILKSLDDVPDVDSDFAPDDRYNVIEYVKNKFWEQNVAHVGAYQSSSLKGTIKDLTRGGVIPFENINMLTKALGSKPEEQEMVFNSMLDFYQGRDVNLSWDITNILTKWKTQLLPVLNIVKTLTWYPKIPTIHACWVIISPVPIETLSPCRYLPQNRAKIWLFDKNEMEHGGLLKYDFLGLNNMQIIKSTIQSILWWDKELREKYGIKISDNIEERTSEDWDNLDWYSMYYDIINNIWNNDEDVYNQVFQMWNTTWVFQFESDWMRKVLKGIKPDCITELGDLCAMFRPWPMQYIPNYKAVKFEGETVSVYPESFLQEMTEKFWRDEVYKNVAFFEDIWNKVTVDTKGILVYQEQLMSFFYYLGHSYTDADFIRKIYSKIKWGKKSFKDLEKYYNKTMVILEEKNIKKEFFDYIYTDIFVDWASYGFNKSHSTCYSIIAYITGWLKCKYPYHYYSVILRGCESDPTKTSKIINEMNILGIDIVWPDLYKSLKHAILKDKQ